MSKGTCDWSKGNLPGKKQGIEIWRLEQLSAKRNDKDHPKGKFCPFDGDAYIILNTKENRYGKLEWDLYFWLGSKCSQDEKSSAAYWVVNLDDSMGGSPVQYREVEDHESQQFLSIWSGGVEYKSGEGAKTGLRKAKTKMEIETRLLQVKGKRNAVRIKPAPSVSAGSLNHGDVFILDTGTTIYLWNGKKASRAEKMKAVEVATTIRNDERGAKAKVVLVDDGKEPSSFWKDIGGKGTVKSAEAGGDDSAASKAGKPELYQVSDASGSLEVNLVKKGKLAKSMLDTNDTFVLTTGKGGSIYCWVGKKCTRQEKKAVFKVAQDFISEKGYPDWTPVSVCKENAETTLFKNNFAQWGAPKSKTFTKHPSSKGVAKVNKTSRLDTQAMMARATKPSEAVLPEGKTMMYRVEDFDLAPIMNAEKYGQFFSGDSYVVEHCYNDERGREHSYIFFWLGNTSSADERGTAALKAKEMDDAKGGKPIQVRVIQGKEPSEFCSLFAGRMIVHEGGRASSFKNRQDSDSYDTDGISLYHVKGTTKINTRAVQVAEEAASLNSGDCFVLLTPDTMFVWQGKGANADEKRVANNVSKILKGDRSLKLVPEGNEPAPFWKAVGGKGEYPTEITGDDDREPRLFQVSDAKGYLACEEIPSFAQADLDPFDIFILDLFSTVYVWIGEKSTANEKKNALKLAMKYVKDSDAHDTDTPIMVTTTANEPPGFKACFTGWDNKFFRTDPLKAAQAALVSGTAADALASYDDSGKSASLTQLKSWKEDGSFPDWVDQSQLEIYLPDAEFKKLFGMEKDAWSSQKAWKKKGLKKKHGLF